MRSVVSVALACACILQSERALAQAVPGYQIVGSKKSVSIKPGESADVKATCPDGKIAIGGGAYTHTDRDSTRLTLIWSAMELEKSWVVGYANNSSAPVDSEIFAQVVCANAK